MSKGGCASSSKSRLITYMWKQVTSNCDVNVCIKINPTSFLQWAEIDLALHLSLLCIALTPKHFPELMKNKSNNCGIWYMSPSLPKGETCMIMVYSLVSSWGLFRGGCFALILLCIHIREGKLKTTLHTLSKYHWTLRCSLPPGMAELQHPGSETGSWESHTSWNGGSYYISEVLK